MQRGHTGIDVRFLGKQEAKGGGGRRRPVRRSRGSFVSYGGRRDGFRAVLSHGIAGRLDKVTGLTSSVLRAGF